MADLLIRDLSPFDKHLLSVRAAQNGRSQQAEARSILEAALREEPRGWVSILRNAAQSAGGIDFELPDRHPARSIDVTEWA